MTWAVVGDDLAPHDLVGLGRVLDVMGVLVGDHDEAPAEDGLVELQRHPGVASQVDVNDRVDAHH